MKVCYINFCKHVARVDRRVACGEFKMPKSKSANTAPAKKKVVDTAFHAHLRQQRLKREALRIRAPL